MIKKIAKYLLRTVAAAIALIIAYLLIGTAFSLIPTHPGEVVCDDKKEIYLTSNGIHLDIIIPADLLEERMLEELQTPEEVEYLAFGWGDKNFYLETPTWEDLKSGVALRALFLKTESALHLTFYHQRSDSWHSLRLCAKQLELLLAYVSDTFERTGDGRLLEIEHAGYTAHDRFYEAKGSFSCLKTCNDWVNRGLKKAQVRTALWSPFDFGVLYHLHRALEG